MIYFGSLPALYSVEANMNTDNIANSFKAK